MDKFKKFMNNSWSIVNVIFIKGLFKNLNDKKYLEIVYKGHFKRKLDLENPQTFNEKLQWLKLYDRNPKYTKMVDKYLVKEFVSSIIGEEYIIPTIGVWENFEDIDFNLLPNQFVLKCTHDSGGIVICKDLKNFNIKFAKKKIKKSLKRNYYYFGREWPYKDVKPRIIAEKYMGNCNPMGLNPYEGINDYKLMCFNGKGKCSFVCSERFEKDGLKVTFFDRNWNIMPFERHYPKSKKIIEKPQNYELMIQLAEKLSVNIPFVRVDFYEVDGKVYFGELTFFPGSGFEEFTPESADYELGEWLHLIKMGV